MPELPEVETIVRDLKCVEGNKIIFVKYFDKIDKIRQTPLYNIDGLMIERVERYGKYIIMKFEKSAYLIHLGMSGKILLEIGNILVPEHCHWLIQMDNKTQIRFVDHRRFGNLWHMPYKDCRTYVEGRLGPEPFHIDPANFILRIHQPKFINRPIKAVLLDQQLVAGLGNIYVSEACAEAFLLPDTLVRDINDVVLTNLLYACRKVLLRGIKNRGTTFMTYTDANNKLGNNQNFLYVYKQKICKRCGTHIIKDKTEGRSTYWCPKCQT